MTMTADASPPTQDTLYSDAIMAAAARLESRASSNSESDLELKRDNRFCGDRVTLRLHMDPNNPDTIQSVDPTVRGCLLTQASAQLLAEAASGTTIEDLAAIARSLRALLKDRGAAPAAPFDGLGVFAPVAAHKSRHECCLLPFEAAEAYVKSKSV